MLRMHVKLVFGIWLLLRYKMDQMFDYFLFRFDFTRGFLFLAKVPYLKFYRLKSYNLFKYFLYEMIEAGGGVDVWSLRDFN